MQPIDKQRSKYLIPESASIPYGKDEQDNFQLFYLQCCQVQANDPQTKPLGKMPILNDAPKKKGRPVGSLNKKKKAMSKHPKPKPVPKPKRGY